MAQKPTFSLRFWLISLLLLAIIPASALTLRAGLGQRGIAADHAHHEALWLARAVADDQADLITEAHQLAHLLAQLDAVRIASPDVCSQFLADLLPQHPRYANFIVVEPNGDRRCGATPADGVVNYADREWFPRVLQTRDFVVGSYVVGRVTQKPLLPFAYPILDDGGQVQAIIAGALDLSWLNQLIAETDMTPDRTLTVIDRNGIILARHPDGQRWVGQAMPEAPIIKTILAQRTAGVTEATGLDGVLRLYAFAPLFGAERDADAYVAVGIPTQVAYAASDALLKRNLAAFGLVTLAALAVAWIGSEYTILRRVKGLLDMAQRLAGGDLSARTRQPHTMGELGELARAFDQMAEAQERRETQLRASEERYRLLADAAHDMIYVIDAAGTIEYANRFVAGFFGAPAERLIGQPLAAIFPAEIAAQQMQTLRQIMAGQQPTYSEEPLTVPGREIWVGTWVVPMQDAQGQFSRVLGVSRDISERKRAEEALRQSEERFARAFRSSPVAVIISRLADGVFLDVNDAACQVYGYAREELIGRSSLDLGILDSADRQEIVNVLMSQGAIRDFEVTIHARGGIARSVLYSVETIALDAEPCILTTLIDITARKQADAERLAREAAEQASRAKSEFLSRMSHELRTPLNAILGFAQLLQMDPLPPRQARGVDQILKSGRHLLDLINEVLDIARIEAGRLHVSPEPVNVAEAVQETLDLVRPMIEARRLTFDLKIPSPTDVFVLADRQRFKQVLLNLLSNAIKYNRQGGEIAITASLTIGGYLRLHVHDTGPGIPAEKLARLWAPFDRLDVEAEYQEGSGLGLPLSKGLIEAMDGRIGVESVVGEGSTFWIELKLVTERLKEVIMAEVDENLTERMRAGRGGVLYVEDNLANVNLVEAIMERLPGVRLITAMQGRLALDLAKDNHPDLVLLDLHLPDVHGSEVLKGLKAEPATQQIPVVIISADAMADHVRQLLGQGAAAYLTKPIDVREFLKAVEEHIAK